jgi:hypothetical protein
VVSFKHSKILPQEKESATKLDRRPGKHQDTFEFDDKEQNIEPQLFNPQAVIPYNVACLPCISYSINTNT